ncbi:hypothetical protein N665_0218s0049, partial [Sinapis alba]
DAVKQNGKSPASFDNEHEVMFFNDLSLGPHESELRFRLIHFWKARNPLMKTLIGLKMLLIDEQGSVIQEFIPPGRIKKYLPHMKQGSIYRLHNFFGSKSKVVYRVADHSITVSFLYNSEMSDLEDIPMPFGEDRFLFHLYEEFQANCDLKIFVSIRRLLRSIRKSRICYCHMKVVNGQSLNERPRIDEVELATTRLILVHIQSHDGPFKASYNTPTIILVMTVNLKRLGGTLALTSMSSSRVFMDYDVQPTKDYLSWLPAKQLNAEVVTKPEPLTIREVFSYMKEKSAKCTATIDDIVHGSAWYYIACGGCRTKATKGPTSLMCTKCGKNNIAGKPHDQAIFVLLGDAVCELTGKHASELVSSYFEFCLISTRADPQVTIPQALINTIGQTHKFSLKVSAHNLKGKTRAITVTKILSPAVLNLKSVTLIGDRFR